MSTDDIGERTVWPRSGPVAAATETGADMRWQWMTVVAMLSVGAAGCDYVPDYVRALFQNKAISGKVYEKGTFKGDLDVRFMSVVSGDGKRVELFQLLAPFGYKDAKGVDWDVPAGFLSDGASIPVELWAVLGGPFSGPYRDAAVVHDYFCWKKDRKWEDVHEVFAEAAAKRGTPEVLDQGALCRRAVRRPSLASTQERRPRCAIADYKGAGGSNTVTRSGAARTGQVGQAGVRRPQGLDREGETDVRPDPPAHRGNPQGTEQAGHEVAGVAPYKRSLSPIGAGDRVGLPEFMARRKTSA